MIIPANSAVWHVTLFGTLQVTDPSGVRPPITRFRTQRSAALLAFLAFHPGQHSREVLAEMLWPDVAPQVGRTRLKQEIATLRRHLEAGGTVGGSILHAEGHAHIGLRAGAISTDAAVFEDLLRQADAPPISAPVAVGLLRQAAALHGDAGLLPGRYEAWVSDARERLLLLYAHALQRIAASAAGTIEAWDAARRAVQAAPFEEESHAALIRLHLAEGNTTAARAQFAQWERIAEEEGEEGPSEILRRLVEGAAPNSFLPAPAVVPVSSSGSAWEIAPAPRIAPARLPPLMTQFFGREKEVSAVWNALHDGKAKSASEPFARLVTLTGPGGIGKTRIALEIAHRCVQHGLPNAPIMVGFAPLAGVSDAGLLWEGVLSAVFPNAEADSLGVPPRQHLIRLLEQIRPVDGDGRVLLVLDNFEQIAGVGAPLIGDFLRDAPFISCLVTSRQRLHTQGEREIPITPLPLPAALDEAAGQKTVPATAAVLLFADRVRAARPDFVLTPRNTALVGEICRMLDGVPLALELAATRVSVMGLPSLLNSLQKNRLDVLVSRERDRDDRHRALRDTIAWSYHLLPPPARHLFVRLSIFRSGWTVGAAQAVGGLSSEADAFFLLEILHDHHLITSEDHDATGETRFQMLETLRQWGAEQLPPTEQAELNEQFALFCLDVTVVADLEMRGEREKYWLARLDAEHDNLRAALVWAIHDAQTQARPEGDPLRDAALRLCDEIAQYWWLKGHMNEGRKWYKEALAASEGFAAPREALSDALRSCASLVHNQGDNDEARELANRALHIARVIGHRRCEAYAHGTLARIALNCGAFQTARDHLECGLSLFALYDPKPGYIQNMDAIQRHNLGIALSSLGDPDGARTYLEETMAYWRSHGMVHRSQIADSLEALGELEWRANKPEAALPLLEEAASIRRNMNVKGGLSQVLLMLGRVHHLLEAVRARPFLRESLVLAHETGDRQVMVEALEAVAASEAAHNRPEGAARLWGMAAALRQHSTPVPLSEHHKKALEAERVRVQETLGRERWESCYNKGRVFVLTTSSRELITVVCDDLDTFPNPANEKT